MRNLDCLRCAEPLGFIKTEKLQLGQTGWFLGDLPNLVSGALEVDIYACPKCGKMHDFDYPKCPFCKFQR